MYQEVDLEKTRFLIKEITRGINKVLSLDSYDDWLAEKKKINRNVGWTMYHPTAPLMRLAMMQVTVLQGTYNVELDALGLPTIKYPKLVRRDGLVIFS